MNHTRLRWTLVAGLLAAVPAGRPETVAGQETPQLSVRCAAGPDAGDAFLAEVRRARGLENPDSVKAALAALEPEARRMAAESPNDVAAQYHLAAVMGAGVDLEHGSSKMSSAEKLRDQALRVLELDAEHAGASYMLGRMHASVMRLGGFKRFMAKQLFGGGALKGASWEQAQTLLETAVRGDPCVPEHHFELARVYAQSGDAAGWEREIGSVLELTAGHDGREARLRERAEQFAQEWRQNGT